MPFPQPPPLAEEDAAFYRAALHELISVGTDLARDIQSARRTTPPELTAEQAAHAFERVARATRRTVLLATRLDDHPRPDPHADRRAVIRAVEDAIAREPRAAAPEARHRLELEFRERLDAPELAEDLASRPVAEIIADILHDMDLGRLPFAAAPHFRRRTPTAIRHLHALARGEAVPPPEPPAPQAPGATTPDPGLAHFLTLLHPAAGRPRTPGPPRSPGPANRSGEPARETSPADSG